MFPGAVFAKRFIQGGINEHILAPCATVAEAWEQLGDAYLKESSPNLAIECYEKALKLDP